MSDLEQLAVDIFQYFIRSIASFLQSVVEMCVVASQQYDQVKIAEWEEITAMKLKEQASFLDVEVGIDVVNQFVVIELGNIELFIPGVIQLVLNDHRTDRQVRKTQSIVEQFADSRLACSRCPSYQYVWHFPMSLNLHYIMFVGHRSKSNKIADHLDFLTVGYKRDMLSRQTPSAITSHELCIEQIRALQQQIKEMQGLLEQQKGRRVELLRILPDGIISQNTRAQLSHPSPIVPYKHLVYEREILDRKRQLLSDTLRLGHIRKNVSDYPRLEPDYHEDLIIKLRQEIAKDQEYLLVTSNITSPNRLNNIEAEQEHLIAMIMAEQQYEKEQEEIGVQADHNSMAAANKMMIELRIKKRARLEQLTNQVKQEQTVALQLKDENSMLQNRLQESRLWLRNELMKKVAYLERIRMELSNRLRQSTYNMAAR